MEQELLSASELEGNLKLGRATILRLANEGKIPCIRLNRRVVRFRLPQVMAAIETLAAQTEVNAVAGGR